MILYSRINEESSIIVIISMLSQGSGGRSQLGLALFVESFDFFFDDSLVFAELDVVFVLFPLGVLKIGESLLLCSL